MFEARVVQTDRGGFRASTLGSGPDVLLVHTPRSQIEHYTPHVIDQHGRSGSERDLPILRPALSHHEATTAAVVPVEVHPAMAPGHRSLRDDPDAVGDAVLGAA